MTRLNTEQWIYVRFNEDRSEYIILAAYVDELVIAGTTKEAIRALKQQINAKYGSKGSLLVTIPNVSIPIVLKEGGQQGLH